MTAVTCFVSLAVVANLATARWGLIPVGLGLHATAGTWAAGLVLLARDWVHEHWNRAGLFAAILAGTLACAGTAGPRLAVASGIAFAIAELVDLAVYQPLRRRGWIRAATASNAAGALVDTVIFLAIAGIPVATAIGGQLFAKMTATLAVIGAVVACRALLRHRVRPRRP
ncbi:VUT family protein [Polymorphospora rubra]|uniref:VUT family protein n=1 Tax=Polymorphospora rubra TaxID=338584 RepID=UPI001BB43710|nr:VUT family protein [Polymorphospora rubra]